MTRRLVLVLLAIGLSAKTIETGFLDRTLTLDGSEYRYQVYVPRAFNRATRWPIIVALHGGGEYGNDGLLQTRGALARAIHQHPDRFPAIVIFPQADADNTPGWQDEVAVAALAAVDKAIKEFNGDPSRVYLTGYSAGGNGAWYLAAHHPERFAAVVPLCGFVGEFRGRASGLHYPPVVSDPDPYAGVANLVAKLPIWIFHGDTDQNVSVTESRRMLAALKAVGANVQYTELPGVDHNTWDPVYDRADLFDWMFRQKRPQ
jgi:predicted peptidase